ncbi:MAG TPA: dihydrodipicolinate synthase family protein [Bacteroidota bacterium]
MRTVGRKKPRVQKSSTGIRGVIPPMMTPFRENESVDYDMFVRNLKRWNREELGGYLVLGSNSEAASLSETEKLKLIGLTVEHAKKGRIILAGTGLESAKETLRLTEKAATLGIDAALVLTPSYYGDLMTDEALVGYFTFVADHSPVPILIYNVPRYTHINVSVEVVRRLSEHPNIIGMKDSRGEIAQVELFVKNAAKDFQVIVGSASVWYPSMHYGVVSGILALSNFAGAQCAQIQTLFKKGDLQSAEELHRKLLPVNAAITTTYGVAGLKYAATLAGYEGGVVRRPLRPLDERARQSIRSILEGAGLLQS